jgi:hypothetical protein
LTPLLALDTISLMDCTSPMAVLSPLLSSRAEGESDILWPALREVKLCRLGDGADEFDGLCDIVGLWKVYLISKSGQHSAL